MARVAIASAIVLGACAQSVEPVSAPPAHFSRDSSAEAPTILPGPHLLRARHRPRQFPSSVVALRPTPAYTPPPKPPPPRSGPVNWDAISECESGGNWATNTGNGYYGGLQMDMPFWSAWGGYAYAGRPDLASKAAQITVAYRAYRVRGLSPWPYCGRFG